MCVCVCVCGGGGGKEGRFLNSAYNGYWPIWPKDKKSVSSNE